MANLIAVLRAAGATTPTLRHFFNAYTAQNVSISQSFCCCCESGEALNDLPSPPRTVTRCLLQLAAPGQGRSQLQLVNPLVERPAGDLAGVLRVQLRLEFVARLLEFQLRVMAGDGKYARKRDYEEKRRPQIQCPICKSFHPAPRH